MHSPSETIAAISTSTQSAAIGVVRLSGPDAGSILRRVVPGCPAHRKPRKVLFGRAVHPSTGESIDDVLCFFCAGPRSATGEDLAELQGHGSPEIMAQLLAACLAAGSVLAHPGEFTYRAVRNGKLDLAQAESVAALIGAKTQRAARIALSQLRGGLAASLNPLSRELLVLSAVLEAALDFPEDDLEPPALTQLEDRLQNLGLELFRLAHGYELGQRLFQGASAVLLGPVNAGKSSLLNALCGQARAIVDAEPGTTRDIVRVTMDCGGIPLELLDTAGLRDKPGRIEQMGIDRAKDEAETADALLLVVDGASDDLRANTALAQICQDSLVPVILVVNKADLTRFELQAPIPEFVGPRLAVSAHNGQGLEELRGCLAKILGADQSQTEPPVVSTKRQHDLLLAAQQHVEQAASLLGQHCELELTAHELQQARKALARLLGGDATEDLLERIFSSFCIGK